MRRGARPRGMRFGKVVRREYATRQTDPKYGSIIRYTVRILHLSCGHMVQEDAREHDFRSKVRCHVCEREDVVKERKTSDIRRKGQ